MNYECVVDVAHTLKRKTDIDKSTEDIRRGGGQSLVERNVGSIKARGGPLVVLVFTL